MQPKVGILTWHQYYNFGSMLQAYALQTTLDKLGYENEIVSYFNYDMMPPPGKSTYLKFLIKKAMEKVHLNQWLPHYFSFQRFYYDKLRKSEIVVEREELTRLAAQYRCLICGSDQIWAPNIFDPVYMADFADEKQTRLISYAASIGLNDIPEQLRQVYTRLLSRFSSIAVREVTGKKLLEECCGIQAEVVLDPTLLLEASAYRNIQRPVRGITQPFIFCYFLNKDHDYRERVERYAKEKDYAIVGVSACEGDHEWMNVLSTVGPEEFLWLVDHAEAVFTDSYHGTIFSIQFHKNFWTFERFSKKDPICQNSRIQQLNRYFGIGTRILAPEDAVDQNKMLDYNQIDLKLESRREESLCYLREVLQ